MKKPTKKFLSEIVAKLTNENAELQEKLKKRPEQPVFKGKPTIAELEALLKNDEESPIQIMPNGEVRAVSGEISDKKPITMKEDLGGEYSCAA